jgi:hypothetical protein
VSVRVEASAPVPASPAAVWAVLTDWHGQHRWIPFTTVAVSGRTTGTGVRAEALSGFRLGRVPVGLLDRFVVTGWRPPGRTAGELEVLHRGPCFTGVGVFRVESAEIGARVTCVEVFDLPGGAPLEAAARAALPLLRWGLGLTLRRLARLAAVSPDPVPG